MTLKAAFYGEEAQASALSREEHFERRRAAVGLGSLIPYRFAAVLDPATRELQLMEILFMELYHQAKEQAAQIERDDETSKALHVSQRALRRHLSFTRELLFANTCSPVSGLSLVMDDSANFISLIDKTKFVMSASARKLGLDRQKLRCILDELAVSERELLATLESTTLAHVALQTHLENFVTLGLPWDRVAEHTKAEALYGGLFELRDEYFTSSDPALLGYYLTLASEIAQTDEYAAFVEAAGPHRATKFASNTDDEPAVRGWLEESTTALEVITLLEAS